jgi:hypothetical protein
MAVAERPPGQGGMIGSVEPIPRRARLVLVATAVAFLTLAATGIVSSLLQDGGVPDFRKGVKDHVNAMLERGDLDGALDQMRLLITLGGAEESTVRSTLPSMARLARDLGRREDELLALRMLARRSADELWVHERLTALLLEPPSPSEAEIREAIGYAEHLAKNRPEAASSWWALARVTQLIGQPGPSAEYLRRAQEIDPTVRLPPAPGVASSAAAAGSKGGGT